MTFFGLVGLIIGGAIIGVLGRIVGAAAAREGESECRSGGKGDLLHDNFL